MWKEYYYMDNKICEVPVNNVSDEVMLPHRHWPILMEPLLCPRSYVLYIHHYSIQSFNNSEDLLLM